jgi:hypothetical protein
MGAGGVLVSFLAQALSARDSNSSARVVVLMVTPSRS